MLCCKELGGACNKTFSAATFKEISELSKRHGAEMYHAKDAPYLEATGKMMGLTKSTDAMIAWFKEK